MPDCWLATSSPYMPSSPSREVRTCPDLSQTFPKPLYRREDVKGRISDARLVPPGNGLLDDFLETITAAFHAFASALAAGKTAVYAAFNPLADVRKADCLPTPGKDARNSSAPERALPPADTVAIRTAKKIPDATSRLEKETSKASQGDKETILSYAAAEESASIDEDEIPDALPEFHILSLLWEKGADPLGNTACLEADAPVVVEADSGESETYFGVGDLFA